MPEPKVKFELKEVPPELAWRLSPRASEEERSYNLRETLEEEELTDLSGRDEYPDPD